MTEITALLRLMERLRDPENGCPWDRVQTFESTAPHTIEEAYEVADAISRGDMTDLASELGDLLFHVVFHARLGEEAGLFDFRDVVTGIVEKMTRRHPHVFADERIEDMTDHSAAHSAAWEAHKSRERGPDGATGGLLDQVTRGLPSMRRALKLQKKAAHIRFDWPGSGPVIEKLQEETVEIAEAIRAGNRKAIRAELGDVLFTCVNLARHLELDPDSALREANIKFEGRFRRMEDLLASAGKTVHASDPEEMERAWEQVKAEEEPNRS